MMQGDPPDIEDRLDERAKQVDVLTSPEAVRMFGYPPSKVAWDTDLALELREARQTIHDLRKQVADYDGVMQDLWDDIEPGQVPSANTTLKRLSTRVATLERALQIAEFVIDIGARLGSLAAFAAGVDVWFGFFREGMAAYNRVLPDDQRGWGILTIAGIRAATDTHCPQCGFGWKIPPGKDDMRAPHCPNEWHDATGAPR